MALTQSQFNRFMNFLAHLFLSGEDPEIQTGNLLGDEVKGRSFENFPERIKIGILLHRFIDNHADTHRVNLEVKKSLYPQMGKYAGVALDIYYDHFLAKHWHEFSEVDINEFVLSAYDNVQLFSDLFSEKSREMLSLMRRYNWLVNYAELEGIKSTFNGMAKRLGNISGMEYAYDALEKHYATIEGSFRDYFPELVRNANNKLLTLQSNQNKLTN